MSNRLNEKMYEVSEVQLKLSKKQDSTSIDLQHFVKLLDKTDTVIRDLTNQLALLREQQTISSQNAQIENISNEGKFYFAAHKLQSTLVEPIVLLGNIKDVALDKREDFVKDVEEILLDQLNNPFLASDKYMFKDWVATHDTI